MTQLSQVEKIESKIDNGRAGGLVVSREAGGLSFGNMAEVMEFAKLMAVSGQAVPPHCRAQPGICLGLTIQAIEWRMSPYAVANKSYVVNDRVAYESQLIHAVIEQRAPITGRLRHSFSGEGAERRCKVWAFVRGESEALVYESPTFATITPKNSPLWKSKPDLQLYYNASRDWARAFFPDVILGVYAEDELEPAIVRSGFKRATTLDDLTAQLAPPESAVGFKDHVGTFPDGGHAEDASQTEPDRPHTSPRREVAASPRKGKASAARERGYQPEAAPDQFERENLDADPPPERKRNGEIFDNQQDAVEAGQ